MNGTQIFNNDLGGFFSRDFLLSIVYDSSRIWKQFLCVYLLKKIHVFIRKDVFHSRSPCNGVIIGVYKRSQVGEHNGLFNLYWIFLLMQVSQRIFRLYLLKIFFWAKYSPFFPRTHMEFDPKFERQQIRGANKNQFHDLLNHIKNK